jgi:DNA repair exonuclease SbcCD nuclease subunit
MSEIAAVFTADLHLAPSAWPSKKINGDSYFALKQIVDYVLENCDEAQPLLLAGDIFDLANPGAQEVNVARNEIRRLTKVGLEVKTIQGNHDFDKRVSWGEAIGADPIHRREFEAKGVVFRGLDFQPAARLHAELEQLPEHVNVLVCHQAWRDLMGELPGMQSEGEFADVPHVDMIATGDYHRTLAKIFHRVDGTTGVALSPGSTCMQAIDETPDKFFYVIRDDLDYDAVPLKSRLRHRVELTSDDALDLFLTVSVKQLEEESAEYGESLPEELRKPLLWVKYSDDLKEVSKRLSAACSEKFHLFKSPVAEVLVNGVTVDTVARRAELAALMKGGLTACLERYQLEGSPEEVKWVKDQARALLLSQKPAEAVTELFDELKLV